ncbi:Sugar Porter (MFS) [Blattamonas nauphoetae]|uniref:Sugar Porter (MFS) n=1 Tax=Blattamonas nauphoetae TaxID=2049346 RepID=A0ABQ9Y4V6_9EUKA|nr:Sugar Porter (MFS) [Blattamonas nauphoetae]
MAKLSSIVSAFTISLVLGATYGLAQSITSGVIQEDPWSKLSDASQGAISSAFLVGGALGSFGGGFLSKQFGAVKTLNWSCITVSVCAIVLSFQQSFILLLIFRFLTGIPIGILSAVAPLHVTKLVKKERSGTLLSTFQLAITIGILLAYLINIIFNSVKSGWRVEFLLTGVLPFLYFTLGCKLDHTPHSDDENVASTELFEDETDLSADQFPSSEQSNTSMFNDAGQEASEPTPDEIPISDVPSRNTPPARRNFTSSRKISFVQELTSMLPSFLSCSMMAVFSQLSGINSIILFSPTIFSSAGVKSAIGRLWCTAAVGAWNFLTTFIPVFLSDRLGIRTMMIAGYGLMALGHLFVILSVITQNLVLSFLGLASFLLGFEVGPGPLTNALLTNNFSKAQHSSLFMSLFLAMNWVTNIILVFSFLPLQNILGANILSGFFILICLLSIALLRWCVVIR